MSSILIGLAVLGYGVTVGVSLLALRKGASGGRPRMDNLHWLACAIFFSSLVVIRAFDLEERVRATLRSFAQDENLYADRFAWQAPLAAIAALLGIILVWLAVRSFPGKGSPPRLAVWISRQAVLLFIPLFAMRIISLHAVDSLLYSGPVRLNWLLEAGLTLTALLAAAMYVRGLGKPRFRDRE